MYRQEDKSAAITEIQGYLLELHKNDKRFPHTAIHGVYDETTRQNVLLFQSQNGLEETGVVGYETFVLLRDSAQEKAALREASEQLSHTGSFPLTVGESKEEVRLLHQMLRVLRIDHPDLVYVTEGRYFSDQTEEAIRYMQAFFLYDTTGTVDERLFLRLRRETEDTHRRRNPPSNIPAPD